MFTFMLLILSVCFFVFIGLFKTEDLVIYTYFDNYGCLGQFVCNSTNTMRTLKSIVG